MTIITIKNLQEKVIKGAKVPRKSQKPSEGENSKLDLNLKFVVWLSPKAQWQEYQSTKSMSVWSLLYTPVKWGKITINQILWYLILVMPHYKTQWEQKSINRILGCQIFVLCPSPKAQWRQKPVNQILGCLIFVVCPSPKSPIRTKTSQPNTWMSDLCCLSQSKKPNEDKNHSTKYLNVWSSDWCLPKCKFAVGVYSSQIGKCSFFSATQGIMCQQKEMARFGKTWSIKALIPFICDCAPIHCQWNRCCVSHQKCDKVLFSVK